YVVPTSAQAQRHDLYYVDRHGQVFILERTFRTPAECERAARAMYESKQVSGVAYRPSTPGPRGLEGGEPAAPDSDTVAIVAPRPIGHFRVLSEQRLDREVPGLPQTKCSTASIGHTATRAPPGHCKAFHVKSA